MFKKILIILFFVASIGARHAVPIQEAFADSYTQDGKPCPPECVSDSMEIVTWYPSPYNEYEELRLYPISDSNSQCNSDTRGLMYYDSDEDKVKLCKGPSGLNNWQDLGAGEMKVTNTTVSCDTANSGMLAFDGVALKLCVNSSWQAIYSPKILGSLHTEYDCISIPGANVVSDSSGNKFCRMSASSCPSGWTSYLNWSETVNKTCSQYCCCNSVSGASWTNSCSTGGHAWSNNGRENCHMWGVSGLCPDVDCNAEIVKIGCY